MRKVTELKGRKMFVYEFNSLWSLIDYLRVTPDNPDFYGNSSETGDYDFTGTRDYKEAEKLCLYGGDKNEFEQFMFLKEKLDDSLSERRIRNIQFNDFIGEVPNVPLYLMGYPLNMIRQEKEEMSSDRVIDIYYNVSVPWYTTKEQIRNRGIIALSLIDYLESLGFKVNLHLFELCSKGEQHCLYMFNLKNIDEATDYRNLFFPLTHPSFLRRILFKLMEKTEGLKSYWSEGYGEPAGVGLINQVFRQSEGNQFIFYDPNDMGIRGENLEEDFDRCIEILGVKPKIESAKKDNTNKKV